MNDKALFKEVCESFESLKFSEYIDCIWRLISAILLLGNHEWDDSTFD